MKGAILLVIALGFASQLCLGQGGGESPPAWQPALIGAGSCGLGLLLLNLGDEKWEWRADSIADISWDYDANSQEMTYVMNYELPEDAVHDVRYVRWALYAWSRIGPPFKLAGSDESPGYSGYRATWYDGLAGRIEHCGSAKLWGIPTKVKGVVEYRHLTRHQRLCLIAPGSTALGIGMVYFLIAFVILLEGVHF